MERVIELLSSSSWLYCCDCQCTVECDFIMCGWVLRTIQRTILQTIGAIIRLVRHVFPSHNNNSSLAEVWLSGLTGWLDTGWLRSTSNATRRIASVHSVNALHVTMCSYSHAKWMEYSPIAEEDCWLLQLLCIVHCLSLSAGWWWWVSCMEWVNGWTMGDFSFAFEYKLGFKLRFNNLFVCCSLFYFALSCAVLLGRYRCKYYDRQLTY